MKRLPGYISTQLHRGIAGSGAFLNYAVWESVDLYKKAQSDPDFMAHRVPYPENVAVSPHLFRPVAVPNICLA